MTFKDWRGSCLREWIEIHELEIRDLNLQKNGDTKKKKGVRCFEFLNPRLTFLLCSTYTKEQITTLTRKARDEHASASGGSTDTIGRSATAKIGYRLSAVSRWDWVANNHL